MSLAAATIAEGPPGLHGWHTINGVKLNDLTANTWPRYKLEKITGLRDRPDSDDNRSLNTGRVGEQPYPSLVRGKTVVFEGIIQAKTLISLETARTALLAATFRTAPTVMEHAPPTARGGVKFESFGVVLGCTIDDDFSYSPTAVPSPWQRNFTLTWRMHQPWFYETTAPRSVTGTTGLVCVNNGTAPTEPKITITHSAADNVVVSNGTTGTELKFDGLPGGDLVITFIDRAAKVGSTSQLDLLDDTLSTWWDEGADGLASGSNTINVTGASGGAKVEWLDAVV